MTLGLTALTWALLVPCTLCWPAAAALVYLVHRSARRHDAQEALERESATFDSAGSEAPGQGS